MKFYSNSSSINTLLYVEFKPREDLRIGDYLSIHLISRTHLPIMVPSIRSVYIAKQSDNHTTSFLNAKFVITYQEIEQLLLPSPYETDCIDYTKLGLVSKEYCYEKCHLETWFLNFKSVHPLSLIPAGSYLEKVRFASKNETDRLEKSIAFYCQERCKKPACFINVFNPIKLGQIVTQRNDKVNLKVSGIPKLRTVYKAQISLIDFITQAFSCISFWFGWAPLPFLLSLKIFRNNRESRPESTRRDIVMRQLQMKVKALERKNNVLHIN